MPRIPVAQDRKGSMAHDLMLAHAFEAAVGAALMLVLHNVVQLVADLCKQILTVVPFSCQ